MRHEMRTGSFVGKIYWSNGERIPSIPVPKTRDWRLFPCLSADYWRLFRIAPLKVKRAPASLVIMNLKHLHAAVVEERRRRRFDESGRVHHYNVTTSFLPAHHRGRTARSLFVSWRVHGEMSWKRPCCIRIWARLVASVKECPLYQREKPRKPSLYFHRSSADGIGP